MKFHVGNRVIITSARYNSDEKFLNHIGIINDIGFGQFSIKILDDDSLNSEYPYRGNTIKDTGVWWNENQLILANPNRRIVKEVI